MNISQIMTRNVETCGPEESLAEAAHKMWHRDVGALPVIGADGRASGMVTDRDICMAAYTQGQPLHAIRVATAMSKNVYACSPNDAIIKAEETMRAQQVRRLVMIDQDGRLVGIVSLNDLAREAKRQSGRKARGEEVTATLSAVCEPRRALEIVAA